jgi:two-component system CheB/CheR fusion protein
MTRKKEATQRQKFEAGVTKAVGSSAGSEEPAKGFPVVGIGASAGGLAAFEAFFAGMPAETDPGMAFVLVQHLAPDYKSILTDLIRRCTRMQVFEVEDGMVVQPNCTYIIPPNYDMAFLNGALQLLPPSEPRGQRLPIDFFFRSLAQDQRERAVGIVLSGTGRDGALGVRAIKGEGGMVMAQSPESTEFDGMPCSAIATGLVDFELPPAEMAAQLIAYAAHAFGKPELTATSPSTKTENALRKIFILLRAQTGHDFSQYKPSTVHRRIDRRMAVHQIELVDEYVRFLQNTPAEVEALFRDLLIGVTRFFRDGEAFEYLEREVIPKLLKEKPAGEPIRIWTAGCSTGEEAYSIAILLVERMNALKLHYPVQIFATDIDSRAIAAARAGLYPASIAVDVTPERLARFFTAEADGSVYRIHKNIRDLLVFSEQDVIKDPPFSRVDLISCRNLLIYMGAELQKKLIPLFHYALKPGGILFLGTSEGVGEFGDLFTALDRKSKIYQRQGDLHRLPRSLLSHFLPPAGTPYPLLPPGAATPQLPAKVPLRELTEQALLQQVVPAGALVNSRGDILYLHGRTGMYLELAPGEAGINNILKMARDGLRSSLVSTFHKAVETKETACSPGLHVKTNSHFSTVNLTIRPVTSGLAASPESPLYLIILEDAPAVQSPPPAAPAGTGQETDTLILALRQELRAKEDYLRSANEELESSTEELKASNEEMQSVNEELQSSNEELETSKEELQSVNEELATVNAELQTKVTDLTRANNDMNNLLAGTGVGTVFVDHQLRILRFTPAASAIINLIPSDVGRPVAHIVSNLVGYDRLVADTRSVLDSLAAIDTTVQALDGKWYAMHIQPYRTLENVIEGAVISFVDVTEIVQARDALRKANEQLQRLAVVVRDANDAITVQDLEGRITAWNPGATRIYGWSEAEALAMNTRDRIAPDRREEELARLNQLGRAEILEPYETQHLSKQGEVVNVRIIATALLDAAGQIYAVATTERPVLV